MRFCRQNRPVFFKISGLVRFNRPLTVSKRLKTVSKRSIAALNRIKKGSRGSPPETANAKRYTRTYRIKKEPAEAGSLEMFDRYRSEATSAIEARSLSGT